MVKTRRRPFPSADRGVLPRRVLARAGRIVQGHRQQGVVARKSRAAMSRIAILLKMIMRGSDDLVDALYRRLAADRLTWPYAPWPDRPAKTWRDLATWALAERALSPAEARILSSPESMSRVWPPSDAAPSAAAERTRSSWARGRP